MPDLPSGEVVATHGRRCLVRLSGSGTEQPAMLRGRELEVCVGDQVRCAPADAGQLVVEAVLERRNLILRSVAHKRKLLAANVDQAFIVIAPVPRYAEEILLRVMIAMRHANVRLNILANKADMAEFTLIRERLASLARLQVPVIEISAHAPDSAVARVAPYLVGQRSLLLGESGMGKSTLLNLLVPDASQRTNDISQALGSGRHTTTSSRLFQVPESIAASASLIDSPGFQQFGLAHLSATEREHAMPEFEPFLGQCRFNNCRHLNEPGCAIREAAADGRIDALRYRLFSALHEADG